MNDNSRVSDIIISIIMPAILALIGIWSSSISFTYKMLTSFIVIIIALVSGIAIYWIPPIQNIWRNFRRWLCSPVLLFFGQTHIHEILKQIDANYSKLGDDYNTVLNEQAHIHEILKQININTDDVLRRIDTDYSKLDHVYNAVLSMQRSQLFGRIVRLTSQKVNNYHIVYTDKYTKTPHYAYPALLKDEAEIVLLIWHFVASNLRISSANIKAISGHEFVRDMKGDTVSGSIAIIGSPIKNPACEELMRKIKYFEENRLFSDSRRTYQYLLEVGSDSKDSQIKLCYLSEKNVAEHLRNLKPDSTVGVSDGDRFTDYAILMKLPNIFLKGTKAKNQTILLLAGCKVGGQEALTKWFQKPENLSYLATRYSGDKFFQIIFECKYIYRKDNIPDIVEITPKYEEEINCEKIMELKDESTPD